MKTTIDHVRRYKRVCEYLIAEDTSWYKLNSLYANDVLLSKVDILCREVPPLLSVSDCLSFPSTNAIFSVSARLI